MATRRVTINYGKFTQTYLLRDAVEVWREPIKSNFLGASVQPNFFVGSLVDQDAAMDFLTNGLSTAGEIVSVEEL